MARRYDTLPLDGPAPELKAPPGAVDTHIHFFDGRYPGAPGGPPPLDDCTPEDYRRVQARLGLEKLVIVQPNAYQFDNRASLDALREFGSDARAVASASATPASAAAVCWPLASRLLPEPQAAARRLDTAEVARRWAMC